MNDFNPDQYRSTLRERLGLKKQIHGQKNFIRPVASAISTNPTPVVTDAGVAGEAAQATGSVDPIFGEPAAGASVDPEAEAAASHEQLAPALALIDTVLQTIHEQTNQSNEKEVGMMWRGLYAYIWKNRDKIAKKMIDDAQ